MTDQITLPPEDAALAAEFAMGLLEGDERAAFAARLRAEPRLLAEVQGWQERLALLAEEVTEVPPARVKRALDARLFGAPRGRALRFWQGLSAVGLALAAVLAVLVFVQPVPEPAPVYAAEIVAADDSLRILAVFQPGTARLRMTRTAGTARPGRALELWLIAGDAPPVSLGVLPEAATVSWNVPEELRNLMAGAALAVSDEPPGGSPTGQPTGDVLAVGAVTAL